jgi:hypothetical protein
MGFNVELVLKDWRIKRNDDGIISICGTYALVSGTTELASKSFGDGYGDLKIPFSMDILKQANELQEKIKQEMQVLIG